MSCGKFSRGGGAGVQLFFVLSGYLSCQSFELKTKGRIYYYKRAVRILPSYYIAVICAILFHVLALKDMPPDMFHLGWFRYFLGLNTILPSDRYGLWNNMYGLWTMSCFIWFYIMAPFIFKWVKSMKSAVGFFAISFVVMVGWKILINGLFSGVTEIENLNVLTGASPFGTLHQFAIGILVYFVLKERREKLGIGMLLLIAAAGIVLKRHAFIWCAACGLVIILTKDVHLKLSQKLGYIVQFMSRESFHVYLAHLLCFDVAWFIVSECFQMISYKKYLFWALFAVLLICFLCVAMDGVEKMVSKLTRPADNN